MDDIKKRLMEAMMQLPTKQQVDERNALPVSEEDELVGLNAMNRSPITNNDEPFLDKLERAGKIANLEVSLNPEQFMGMSGGINTLGNKLGKEALKLVKLKKLNDNLDNYFDKNISRMTNREIDKLNDVADIRSNNINKLEKKLKDPNSEISDLWEQAGYSPNQQRRAFERQRIRNVNPGITEEELFKLQQQPHKELSMLDEIVNNGMPDSKRWTDNYDRLSELQNLFKNKNPEDYKHLYDNALKEQKPNFDQTINMLKKIRNK